MSREQGTWGMARVLCALMAMAALVQTVCGFDADNPKVLGIPVVPRVTSHIEVTSTNNEAGAIEISSATNLYTVTMTTLIDGSLAFKVAAGTNSAVLKVQLQGDGSLSLSAQTNRLSMSGGQLLLDGSPIGTTINPTDGVVPVRSGASSFTNSPISISETNSLFSGGVRAFSFYSPTIGPDNQFGFQDLGGSEFPSIFYGGAPVLGVGSRVFLPYLTDNRFLLTESASHNLVTDNSAGVFIQIGSGSPEGVVTAGPGALFLRTDGGAGTTFYVKESGTGNTGWVGK